jgi:sulfite dehydrogenase (cytochrome) subunit B
MMKQGMICLIAAIGLSASPIGAEQKSITLPPDNAMATLKAGPGVEVARANCVACHSTDYVVRQPPVSAEQWSAEVKKMVTVFGAPISDADAKVIAEYLASAYGRPTNENAADENIYKKGDRGNADRARKPAVH